MSKDSNILFTLQIYKLTHLIRKIKRVNLRVTVKCNRIKIIVQKIIKVLRVILHIKIN